MSLFSDEVRQRCDLDHLIVEEIDPLPDVEDCLIGDIPISEPLEFYDDIPEDGKDGCDAVDGIDGQDGVDGIDGRDGLDGIEGRDGCDAVDGIDGQDGIDGIDGRDGLDGIDGKDGCDAVDGVDGQDGIDGIDGRDGLDGINGLDGKDGCDAVDGADGIDGIDGIDGYGLDGKDAYELAVENGFDGTLQDWLDSLKGEPGEPGEPGPGGGNLGSITGTIQEPCRCPLFRSVEPDPWYAVPVVYATTVHADRPSVDAAHRFGSVKLPGKTYEPIKATYWGGEPYDDGGITAYRQRGELMEDANGNQLYLKKRVPKTSSNMLVLREDSDTSEPIEWIYTDGNAFDDSYILPPKPMEQQHGWGSAVWNNAPLWETTTETDENLAQYNYDFALCRNMDWSELLIEGDKVPFQEHTIELEIDKIDDMGQLVHNPDTSIVKEKVQFTYYEMIAPDSYLTPVEGQAKIVLKIVSPQWINGIPGSGSPDSFSIHTAVNENELQPPNAPDFETVYLKLVNRAIPDYHKTQGICNDCTMPRVRGVFIRRDVQGRGYPMLFEVPTLRVGNAIRSRTINCYYKTEYDNCSPKGIQPEMKLIRPQDWRLILDPDTCSMTCTELNDNSHA